MRGQSVRQLDGEYFTGVTSHDQITVLAMAFHDGVSVMLMPEVPIDESDPPMVMMPSVLTVAPLTLPPVPIDQGRAGGGEGVQLLRRFRDRRPRRAGREDQLGGTRPDRVVLVGGQSDRRQNPDDRHDDHQFDQGKPLLNGSH